MTNEEAILIFKAIWRSKKETEDFSDIEIREACDMAIDVLKKSEYQVNISIPTDMKFEEAKKIVDYTFDMAKKKLKMEWIPVSKLLPKDGDTYIVNIEYKCKFEGVDVACFRNSNKDGYIDSVWETWNDWIEDESKYYHVTAWMPLPDPYKEDE